MASSVFYKFASRKDESRVTFDGTGISVFDLKRDIILANNMGKANDFDLVVIASDTKEEYKDDSQIIPRSSFVIVKRVPSARPGKGKASMYIAGAGNVVPTSEPVSRFGGAYKGAMSKRFDHKDESSSSKAPPSAPTSVKSNVANEDEAAAMAAMFQAQNAVWEETQEKMSHATPIIRNTRGTGGFRGGKPHMPQQSYQPERPLPASYVCYRCGQKGHWIKDCPTNSDREFDNKPRLKRTTGIPRSMLKAVEGPQGQLAQGVMVTPEGGYVVAQPDSVSWQRQVSRKQGITAAEVRERPPSDLSLACPIDNKLLRDAVSTPCCGTVYCEDCIQTHLLERDFICPNCSKKIASLDKLIADKPTRTKVNDYIEKAIEESKKDGEEEDDTNKAGQSSEDPNSEQDFYSDQQPGMNMDMIVESIPQLQAQISQISAMLQNSSLPNHVRQQTEMHHQQLNMQLQQAQTISATMAAVASFQQQQQQMQQQVQNNPMGFNMQQGWTNPYSNQQPAGQDSPYQRLPVNNRRRNLKRERPSDFLEVGGENDAKVQRFWE
ncbi:DWNN-domain-containing protein [Dendrothele bispora CBS 962.96]|uniref:DWNN-domain-containing protein n=1 Tax=Dendrothele bispora (strain CBS 962.96) TaxID=1314807 RepID=A0A4S8LGN4_DENBC|nr:DWNN-domain-containing protein [Dendrothele bispora CBS 962.96]